MVDKKQDDGYNPGDKFADDGQGFAPLRKDVTKDQQDRVDSWMERMRERAKQTEKAPENG